MKIQHQYIGDWPIREAYKQRLLKYHSEMAKKKAHTKVDSALVQYIGIFQGYAAAFLNFVNV